MRRDVSERERSTLTLMHPRLNRASSNARTVRRLQEDLALIGRGLETLACGVITLTPTGRVGSVTACARRWATEYLGSSLRDGDRLPQVLDQWVRHERARLDRTESLLPCAPLILRREGRRLSVRLAVSADQALLLLEEQPDAVLIRSLERFGLSRREAEVLTWVTRGKSNADVGQILSVSARTVEKHLERVYQKLGVESRTAAVAVALESPPG